MTVARQGAKKTLADCVVATRPWSFTMSLISVTVGTLAAWEDGPVHLGWYLLVCLGIVCFHATANIYNDYFDTRYQVDRPDSPTARYRPQPILSGLFTPAQLLGTGIGLNIVTVVIGCILAFERSLAVLWIGFVGFLASFFYTAGPVKYKYRALGEFSVFLMWGPLMFEGAYAVQRQALGLRALYLSVPFGILVALVLLANNIRDITYDTRQGIQTVAIRLGEEKSLRLYAGLVLTAFAAVVLFAAVGLVTPWVLLVFLAAPKAVRLIRMFRQKVPEAADAITAQLNAIFGLLLIAGLVLGRVVPL